MSVVEHRDATQVHKGLFRQSSDPSGDVTQDGVFWIDTTAGAEQLKVRSGSNTAWTTLPRLSGPSASKTTTYTATGEDFALLCDATSAAFSVTLPAAASHTGRWYFIKKTDSSGNAVTIDGDGSDTIDGAATMVLSNQYEGALIHSNGTAWSVVAHPLGAGEGNAISKTLADAKGDLLAASAADTFARLAVGTNGQVLTADSAETTGVKWADAAAGPSELQDLTDVSSTASDDAVDGDVLTWDGAEWVPEAPSGSVTLPAWLSLHPDAPAASPDADDDEFDDTTGMSGTNNGLNARWAWRNQGGATIAYANGCAVITLPGAAAHAIRGIEQTPPAAPWKYRAKVSLWAAEANSLHAGLFLVDNTNGDLLTFTLARTSAGGTYRLEVNQWTNVTTFSAGAGGFTLDLADIRAWTYLEIENDATNLNFSWSQTGVDGSYLQVHTQTLASFIGAADRIGVGGTAGNASNNAKVICEWFRKV